jgi:hypothetical protein
MQVVIGENATSIERHAAEDLAADIEAVTGTRPDIIQF